MAKIGILDMSDAVAEILREYGDSARDAVKEAIKEVGKEAAKELKAKSPKKTGKYGKGWKTTTSESEWSAKITLYNKDAPQLTHLLENGHAKRGGGRVASIEHIRPVEQWANEEVIKRIKRELG